MTIKCGKVVSHTVAQEWGTGKVVEVGPVSATILFSDGVTRKIASSHYTNLLPADPASFVPIPEVIPVAKVRVAAKRVKKVKQVEI
ncbi:hypothetical protein JCM15764A_11720 [Geotalea toluenoxydans]|nr:DUF3553 domain-containing protein [Geotalea toluenoxydans]